MSMHPREGGAMTAGLNRTVIILLAVIAIVLVLGSLATLLISPG